MSPVRRVAALYDIHGNLPALEAVLEEVLEAEPDEVVVGGDVLPGPMPGECIQALTRLPMPTRFIHGNGDRDALTILGGGEPAGVPKQFYEALRWSGASLGKEDLERVASWPGTWTTEVDGIGPVLFCHATPNSDREVFTGVTPEEGLKGAFDAVEADVVVCGHTHMQFDRRIGRVRVVNAGSVGMPFGEPGAEWLLLGPDCELRRTTYDLQDAAVRIGRSPYPAADQFAQDHVLSVPSAASMIDLFENAAPR